MPVDATFRPHKLKTLGTAVGTMDPPPQPVVLCMCGSFSPIHMGHIKIYSTASETLALHEGPVPFVVLGGFMSPVGDGYKKEGLAPFAHRAQIVEAALEAEAELECDFWEGLQPTYQSPYSVMMHLQEEIDGWYESTEPDEVGRLRKYDRSVRIVFVCGADLFLSFFKDKCWSLNNLSRMLDRFSVVVIARSCDGSDNVEERWREELRHAVIHQRVEGKTYTVDFSKHTFIFGQMDVPDGTSSTAIRKLLQQHARDDSSSGIAASPAERQQALRKALGEMVPPGAMDMTIMYYSSP